MAPSHCPPTRKTRVRQCPGLSDRASTRKRWGRSLYRLALSVVEIEALLEREGLLPFGLDHAHHSVEAALSAFLTALAGFDMSVGFEIRDWSLIRSLKAKEQRVDYPRNSPNSFLQHHPHR